MARYWTGPEFLSFLNSRVCTENGDVCVKSAVIAEEGEPEPRITSEIVFAQPVDLIIEGYCPYAEGVSGQREWFIRALERTNAKTIVLFPGCCKEYPGRYLDMLRSIAPDAQWLFPYVCDLEGEFGDDRATVAVAQHLMDAGIIGLKPLSLLEDITDDERLRREWEIEQAYQIREQEISS